MQNLSGYWTGTFEGTNFGGLSLTIEQSGDRVRGVANMNEVLFGVYEYSLVGEIAETILLHLNGATTTRPGIVFGIVEVDCSLRNDGTLIGRWRSSIQTHGTFIARRYIDPKSAAGTIPTRTNIFISYSHADKEYLDGLLDHLKPIQKAGLIDAWSDARIGIGGLWKDEINAALERAHVAILLVSAKFIASDFISNNELPPLLYRAQTNGIKIMPMIVGVCRFSREESLNRFQAANDPHKPLASLSPHERDVIFDRIANEVENLAKA